MKTYSLKSSEVSRKWCVIDAKGVPLGRVAAKAARILMGKHKPSYTPHIDDGDFVVILNADKFILTGRKPNNKYYWRYSGFVGGLKKTPFKAMIEKKPLFPMQKAVKGMLPKTKLARQMIKKLRLFEGSEHGLGNVDILNIEIEAGGTL